MCVLRVLRDGPTYGYAIASRLERSGLGVIKGGTLYPLLARLEAAGWVEIEWRAGEGGPGRKFYALTPPGRDESHRQDQQWDAFIGAIQALSGTTLLGVTPGSSEGGHNAPH